MKKMYIMLVLAGMLMCIFSCSSPSEKTLKNGKLTIIYSGNIGARYDPCGCRIPLGGLARRSTAFEAIKQNGRNVLALDSGALLYERHQLYPPYEVTMRMTANLMVEMIEKIGIDAVNVSSMDLANSVDSLLAVDKVTSWAWLSANIVWKDSNELVFKPDIIRTVDGLRIGIFGLIDLTSRGIPLINDNYPIKALDPFKAAKREIEKLKNETDLIIALAYMEKDRAEELVGEVDGIDIIIQGHTREHNPSSDHIHFLPYKIYDTIFVRCPDGGRVLGVLDLEIWNGSLDFVNAVENVDLRPESMKQKEDTRDKKSNFTHEFINLDPSIERDREIQDYLNLVGGRIEDLREKLKKASEKS